MKKPSAREKPVLEILKGGEWRSGFRPCSTARIVRQLSEAGYLERRGDQYRITVSGLQLLQQAKGEQ